MARPLIVALALACASPALAGEATLSIAGSTVTVPVVSLKEARFHTVVRQEHDFSCGSAAVATLLTHHYGRPTSEEEVFRDMYAAGDQEAIRRQGFSLFDMQRYLAVRGLRADGYRVPLDTLAEVAVPAVTLISTKGYSHFVVIKGIRGGEVLVGDPALGLKAMPKSEFEPIWQGIVFVVRDDLDLAHHRFNQEAEWAVRR
ncbi:MAG: C39 family peptidase, partial [Magnetospirillum sp.]|nr:C39 family peptidase [Magnetospirillum sp.]